MGPLLLGSGSGAFGSAMALESAFYLTVECGGAPGPSAFCLVPGGALCWGVLCWQSSCKVVSHRQGDNSLHDPASTGDLVANGVIQGTPASCVYFVPVRPFPQTPTADLVATVCAQVVICVLSWGPVTAASYSEQRTLSPTRGRPCPHTRTSSCVRSRPANPNQIKPAKQLPSKKPFKQTSKQQANKQANRHTHTNKKNK